MWMLWAAVFTSNSCVTGMKEITSSRPFPNDEWHQYQDRNVTKDSWCPTSILYRLIAYLNYQQHWVSMQPNCILLCAWPCHNTVSTAFLTLFPGSEQIRIFLKDHFVYSLLLTKQNQLLLTEQHPRILVTACRGGDATACSSHCPTTSNMRQLVRSLIAL